MMRDPLEILGLTNGASKSQIKRRYRLLSKQFHPDLNPNDPEAEARFKEVQWAYDMLSSRESGSTINYGGVQARSEPDLEAWSDKPFTGFFWAMRAMVAARGSRNSEIVSGNNGEFSQDCDE
jgi:DnaJ-class molecular chaperone